MIDWSACPGVESVPGKHSGDWVFTGTRLPVYTLFENLEGGATVEEFMDWFHPVDESKVRAVFRHVAESLRASAPTGRNENPARPPGGPDRTHSGDRWKLANPTRVQLEANQGERDGCGKKG